MSDDTDTIIERIQKCLALARCAGDGSGEAAAAMLAARRLMDKYRISESAVQAAGIGESRVGASMKQTPTEWESGLARMVAQAFGCASFFISYFLRKGEWVFVGPKSAAAVASYAFAVLDRQARAARRRHLKPLRRCTQATKTRRGDLFCLAWVSAVAAKVGAFAGEPEQRAAIDAYMGQKYQVVKSVANDRLGDDYGNVRPGDAQSYFDGQAAAASVTLHRGMNGEAVERALLPNA